MTTTCNSKFKSRIRFIEYMKTNRLDIISNTILAFNHSSIIWDIQSKNSTIHFSKDIIRHLVFPRTLNIKIYDFKEKTSSMNFTNSSIVSTI